MDLSVVQEILNNVATFGKNIEDFMLLPINLINELASWFNPEGTDNLSSAWETTEGVLSSSN